jgi:hypothetical protein
MTGHRQGEQVHTYASLRLPHTSKRAKNIRSVPSRFATVAAADWLRQPDLELPL